MNAKWIYHFGADNTEGRANMRDLLGGKGANLAEMCGIGLPVPPGFTMTTELCTLFYQNNEQLPNAFDAQLETAMHTLEQKTGTVFGDKNNPLLVSVRSGARASMPGMMDTVLNLGLNEETTEALASQTGDRRFALDSARRFIQMFSNVVLGISHELFEDALEEIKQARSVSLDTELDAAALAQLLARFHQLVASETGKPFPHTPSEQLRAAIAAVFRSWHNPRAATWRKLNNIPDEWGTAVTIQTMVFGNMGQDCATGVAFTRDPSNGENQFFGEYLINAQGEDVVAGLRTPHPLTEENRKALNSDSASLERAMPEVFQQLLEIRSALETHFRDMQDIEFTVQKGRLYMLQTRAGKRTAQAAIKIATDMVAEKRIDRNEALLRLHPPAMEQLLHPRLDSAAPRELMTRALPASPGAASGKICFTADKAETLAQRSEPVLLVREETSPEDIHGMHAARGIITARGGMTSHAAVVARGMGRPCVVGASALFIDVSKEILRCGEHEMRAGDWLTIDGARGEIFKGKIPTREPQMTGDFALIMDWADQTRRLRVRANAEQINDVRTALHFGAEGIGLCRTEHMFFDEKRIMAVRQMILAADSEGRRAALAKIEPFQMQDFLEIFRIMKDLPVTIRLLDPPLHEFLPHSEPEFAEIAKASQCSTEHIVKRTRELSETNPMLGTRGCRLLLQYPEIVEMQCRAIFKALKTAASEQKGKTAPKCEIMVPLVATAEELKFVRRIIDQVWTQIDGSQPRPYQVGTMIELPRAALQAETIAEHADFFSFGTNDLTQTCWGLSRDDTADMLTRYEAQKIIDRDPFRTIDRGGVGTLVRLAVEGGRKTQASLRFGICGEHGGDPDSIDFFEKTGLDYVSCSPYRVPIARLAAAQSAIRKHASVRPNGNQNRPAKN